MIALHIPAGIDQLLSKREAGNSPVTVHQLQDEHDISKSTQIMLQNIPQEIVFGFLSKKGKGESLLGRRNWKRRWFMLKGPRLVYYETASSYQNGFDTLGEMDLTPDTMVECLHKETGDHKKAYYHFQVVTQQRTLKMFAFSEEERQAWMNQINLHKTMSRRRTLPFL